MKKFIGAICSALAGIFTFVWLSLDWFKLKASFGGMSMSQKATGWELITNKYEGHKGAFDGIDGYKLTRVFLIISLVLACLLIVSAVVLLLKNLGVLKIGFNVSLINNILLAVFVVCVAIALIGMGVMGADQVSEIEKSGAKASAMPMAGSILQAVTAVAACACGWALARKDA